MAPSSNVLYLDDETNRDDKKELGGEEGIEPIVFEVLEHTVDGHRIIVGEVPDAVRALVPATDNMDEPCETFRAYFLGTVVCVVATALNTWFESRQPGIYLSPLLAQFVVHPVGVVMAKVLPKRKFTIGGTFFSLNPGPWSIKEHCIVTMMATVSLPTATALDIISAIKLPMFFDDPALGGNIGFQITIVLATQFLGFGIAGLAREFVVYPSSMIWPLNLAKVSLFSALHGRKVNEDGSVVAGTETEHAGATQASKAKDPPVKFMGTSWTMSMFRFCLYATLGAFCWTFVTEMIFPFFLYFNWPTWGAPTNAKLAIIMGSITGLGLNPLPTLDWSYISGAGLTPLISPWWATVHLIAGAMLGFVILVALYFSNTWYTGYLLPNSNAAFDRFGLSYNVSAVLTADKTLDVAAYEAYSPLYYSAGYNIVLGAYFACYSAAVLFALLNYWPQFVNGAKTGYRQWKALITRRKAQDVEVENRPDVDIHYVFARQYMEVPQWWFAIVCIGAIVLGIVNTEVYNLGLPVWGIFCCLAMSLIFLIPSSMIMALSNVQISLVILAEIIPGVAIPGVPYANMAFKLYGWISLSYAQWYLQDQKLGHYLHVPPRATFRAQFWGVLLCSFISIATLNWQMSAIPDLCETGQKDLLTCPYITTFYSSALLFGVVGPERVYGSHGLYKNLLWAFFIGAALTVLAWLAKRRWPNKITSTLNVPVMLIGTMYFAPYNVSYIWSGVPLAWFFMSFVYKRYSAWWNKYVYLLSIGLTIGVAISAVVQFFCITYPGASIPAWWGNTFYLEGCDAFGCPLVPLPEAGYFGPGPGDYN